MQIIACDISTNDRSVTLDQDSGAVLVERLPDPDFVDGWTNWSLPSSDLPAFLQPVRCRCSMLPFLFTQLFQVGQLPSLSPPSDVLRNVTVLNGDDNVTATRRLTLLEEYVQTSHSNKLVAD